MKLLKKPSFNKSNLSLNERTAIEELSKRADITIQKADKGGKVVMLETNTYTERCKTQLSNTEFYEHIDIDPNEKYSRNIQNEVTKMFEDKLVNNKEYKLLKLGFHCEIT